MKRAKQRSSKYEGTAIFINASVGVMLAVLLSSIILSDSNSAQNNYSYYILLIIFVSMLFFGIYGIYIYYDTKKWFTTRVKKLAEYAAQNNLKFIQSPQSAQSYISSTLHSFGTRDKSFSNSVSNENWLFGDYSFAIYRKTKGGEYKEKTVYYSVFSIELPRALPNVFFDAKATKGREFRKLFDDSQLHSLEGNFDTFFHTYFPTYYTIDSLSFITPEVMQALINARDFDIEISGNKLYLYQRLKVMPQQIEHALLCGQAIYKSLMNNIQTYRDERLDYASGRQAVSVAGIRLRRGLLSQYAIAVIGIFLLLCAVAFYAFVDVLRQTIVPYIFLFLGLSAISTSSKAIFTERALRRIADNAQYVYKKSQKHR